jgi:hypothetical protein
MRGGAQICTYVRLIRARFIPSPSLYEVLSDKQTLSSCPES